MNTRLQAVTDAKGRLIRFLTTAGQASDDTGAAALPGHLPAADWLLADRGHHADWFREALQGKGIKPCIPGRSSRGKPVKHDKRRRKRRNRIEIIFGRLKGWPIVGKQSSGRFSDPPHGSLHRTGGWASPRRQPQAHGPTKRKNHRQAGKEPGGASEPKQYSSHPDRRSSGSECLARRPHRSGATSVFAITSPVSPTATSLLAQVSLG